MSPFLMGVSLLTNVAHHECLLCLRLMLLASAHRQAVEKVHGLGTAWVCSLKGPCAGNMVPGWQRER